MIAVTFESPSAIVYKLEDVASVASTNNEKDTLGLGMHLFGVIITRSIPPALVELQRQQSEQPRWKLTVFDGKNTFQFTNVWFHARPYDDTRFRIDFGSETGPANLHLGNPR